jgi:hypothetical protein
VLSLAAQQPRIEPSPCRDAPAPATWRRSMEAVKVRDLRRSEHQKPHCLMRQRTNAVNSSPPASACCHAVDCATATSPRRVAAPGSGCGESTVASMPPASTASPGISSCMPAAPRAGSVLDAEVHPLVVSGLKEGPCSVTDWARHTGRWAPLGKSWAATRGRRVLRPSRHAPPGILIIFRPGEAGHARQNRRHRRVLQTRGLCGPAAGHFRLGHSRLPARLADHITPPLARVSVAFSPGWG